MDNLFTYIFTGIAFGITAGFSPGPLTTLIITETLRHDLKAGFKVSLAPILTDLPIVLFTLWILSKLSSMEIFSGIISILGGLYIIKLGWECLTIKGVEVSSENAPRKSLRKGFITNILSPNPYLFWGTVGAPLTIRACSGGVIFAAGFILFFYICLVGSKLLIAYLVDKSRVFLKSRAYLIIMKSLGIMMFIFAAIFLKNGIKALFF